MKGIELEEPIKVITPEENKTTTGNSVTTTKSINGKTKIEPQTLKQAAAQNFGKILELAGSIVEIKKMEVASNAILAKMDKDRQQLLAEAEAYVLKKNADTNSVVERMNLIRLMMQDFYQQSNQQITSEDFKTIITSIVEQMGKIKNG